MRASVYRLTAVTMLASICATMLGCQSFKWRGAVPHSVASCRQLSQEGVSALHQGDLQSAKELLNKAVQACPSDPDARTALAEVLWELREGQAAIEQLREVIRLSPDDPHPRIQAGEIFLEYGLHQVAGAHAEQALRSSPQMAKAWTLRARSRKLAGDLTGSVSDFHRALQFATEDKKSILMDLALVYQSSGKPGQALSTLQQLEDLYAPEVAPAMVVYLEGLALTNLDRCGDAVEHLELAGERGMEPTEVLYRIAAAQWKDQQPQAAQTAARQALSITPGHEPSRQLLNDIRLASRNRESVNR